MSCSVQDALAIIYGSLYYHALININTAAQTFGISTIYGFKEDYSAHQGWIYLIKNTEKNGNIVKYYFNLKVSVYVKIC